MVPGIPPGVILDHKPRSGYGLSKNKNKKLHNLIHLVSIMPLFYCIHFVDEDIEAEWFPDLNKS